MSYLFRVYNKININVSRWYSICKIDPGINLRKKIVDSNEEIEEIDLDDLDADFMNVHKTHKQHVLEVEIGLEKEKFHIVRQKYFHEKNVNFLTWHDKEQIRYLYYSDSEEWTIEKLSEGFPALPEDVKKIVKSKWTINPSRITKHDRSVQRNWENFKNGQISNLSEQLVDHLNKFTNRALNFKPFVPPKDKTVINVNFKPTHTEFSEIITSYNELKAKKCNSNEESITNIDVKKNKSNINNLSINKNTIKSKPLTLYQLQSNIESRINKGRELSEDEKLLLKGLKLSAQEISSNELNQNNLEELTKNKYESSKRGSLMTKKQLDFSHLIYPGKIIIPKNVQKKGYTYKLNDCYYDADGEFLYRVPGMD